MTIYFVVFLYLFFSRYILSDTENDKKIFCISIGIILYLLVALRNINLGVSDTAGFYYSNFLSILYGNWAEVLSTSLKLRTSVFTVLTKLIVTLIGNNYQLYLAIIGIPYILAVSYMIYRYSNAWLMSFVAFVSMYYMYSFFLLRQVLAVALIVLSLKYIYDKKPIKFILMVLIATSIHNSAMIFLFAYPFARFVKSGVKNFIIIASAFITSKFFPSIVYVFSGSVYEGYAKNGVYETDSVVSLFPLFIYSAIILFAIIVHANETNEGNVLINLVTLAAVVYPFVSVVSEIYRVAIYFGIFSILLVPQAVSKVKRIQLRTGIYIVIIVIYILYFAFRTVANMNANPYLFFWN